MEPENKTYSSNSGSGIIGCLGGFVSIFFAAAIFMLVCGDNYKLQPGEANMCMEALQLTFDEINRIKPDSLIVSEEFDPRNHYSSCESFGNIVYVVNPVIKTHSRTDTSKVYNFQYLARVNHLSADEYQIKDFLIDSVWKPFNIYDNMGENPFDID